MRLLSLLGLDRRLRRLRIAAGEGALAAEDRAKLLKLAWDEERQRLRLLVALVVAVIGLTTVTVALLSVAIVVHFWDTPNRVPAAWAVAGVWIAAWLLAVLALLNTLRRASTAFEPARREFERDWEWVQAHFHGGDEDEKPAREPRPLTRDELLARIARQRERIATLESAAPKAAEAAPADESASAAALRIAREHPVATGAAAAAAAVVIGPRRLLRWAAVIVPVLWRMR
ncbi:phage holin family protein [Variovorax sp. RA8]|uniref:phage holin family protein n=1 Tax=Variovorax sp. (strain JCM 16519 / RA8) TaxID=662548 RepID=UPI00131943C7|nr:phage holin family protein [Variovorax sp. RA8]VTU29988.1 putative membrane protein [Variovorax sp. RA8]